MVLQIIQQILGIILFFTPGILFSYIICPNTDIIKRGVYSIVLAISISVLVEVLLYILNLLTPINIILVLIFLNILFLVRILISNRKYKTDFNKDFLYLIFFSLIGTIWRILFIKSIKNFGDAYTYSGKFVGETIPDLGFYTGMVIDHSRFIGGTIFSTLPKFLLINRIINNFFGIFLITFLFLGFIYLIFSLYRNKKLAYLGVALMSLGPVEIFHTTLNFFGHPLSYIALFSLFLLYKSDDVSHSIIALLLSVIMVFTYFTSAMVNALASIGFIIALFSKDLVKNKNIKKTIKKFFKNEKILFFMLITVISISFIFGSFSSKERSSSNKELIVEHITTYPIMEYQDPTFLGLSAIRWQMLFFFLCGLTFIFHIIGKRDFSENNLNLLLCLIPILIISGTFLYANAPTRIFNYFAFFGLLALKIQKKYLKTFFVLSFIFLLITSFYVAKDKRIFFEISDKEIEGALWIKNYLQGRIFSDQPFINQLILDGYYNVTGANDDDPLVYSLFYQKSTPIFLNATNYLNTNLDVSYIALIKRMQEKYILMLNIPQKPLINSNLYEENLVKVYDNGDVRVYKLNRK